MTRSHHESSSFSEKDAKEAGIVTVSENPQLYRPEVDTSSVDEKKLSSKIDLRTIPWLALLYLLNSLDRGSVGNAKVRATWCGRRMSN
jgi:hypothetical protein